MLEVVKFSDIAIGDELLVVDAVGGALNTVHGRVTDLHNDYGEEEIELNEAYSLELFSGPGEADPLVALRITKTDE
jgi:hypothetical protein